MNKETLVKHKFWIALAVFLPIWLVGLILMLSSAGSEGTKFKKANEDVLKGLESFSAPKNPAWFLALERRKKELEKYQEAAWQEVAKTQENLLDWPTTEAVPLKKNFKDMAFGDPIKPLDQSVEAWRRQYQDVLYRKQFENPGDSLRFGGDFVDLVSPALIRDGWWALLRPMTARAGGGRTEPAWPLLPTDEEVWLAQEDFAVRRELLRMLREAMDAVGRFHNLAKFKRLDLKSDATDRPLPTLAPGVTPYSRDRYLHPSWELDLVLERNDKGQIAASVESQLKNVFVQYNKGTATGKRLSLNGLRLMLYQRDPFGRLQEGRPWMLGELKAQGNAVDPQAWSKFLTAPVELKSFEPRLPIEVSVIADPNDAPPEKTVTPTAGRVVARQRFRNPSWEVDLLLGQDEKDRSLFVHPDSTIKNVSVSRRPLSAAAVELKVRQTQLRPDESDPRKRFQDLAPAVLIHVPAGSVDWQQTTRIVDKPEPIPFHVGNWNDWLDLEQVFNWQTAPIKRIDRFEVGNLNALSDRQYLEIADKGLQARKVPEESVGSAPVGVVGAIGLDPGGVPGPGEAGGPGGKVGAPPGGEGDLPPGPGEGGAITAASSANRTPVHGLDRNRYLRITGQVVEMPVGIALVVDQQYIPDILASFSNSRLRFVTTQYVARRTQLSLSSTSLYGETPYPSGEFPGGVPVPGVGTPGGIGGGKFGAPRIGEGDMPERGGPGVGFGPGGFAPGGFGPGGVPGPGEPGGPGGPGGPIGFGGPVGTGGFPGDPGASAPGYGTTTQPTLSEEDANLVELGVYGVITLYERYRPTPKGEAPKDEQPK
jgi:hypothetical protein